MPTGGQSISMRTVIGILLIVAATSAADFSPARRISGSLPSLPPPNTIGWVEETVEVEVDARGRVARATLLNAASRGPSLVVPAVADWRFKPALEHGQRVASRVLVAAMFRPPTLYDIAPPVPPAEHAATSNEIPFPIV